jgi:hypothetical protein
MRDARYLRRQADLCLEMARKIGDPVTSDSLVAEAARYHAEARQDRKRRAGIGDKSCPRAE